MKIYSCFESSVFLFLLGHSLLPSPEFLPSLLQPELPEQSIFFSFNEAAMFSSLVSPAEYIIVIFVIFETLQVEPKLTSFTPAMLRIFFWRSAFESSQVTLSVTNW